MNSFHFPKLVSTVGPSLAKETVLSKVINLVDAFRINLSLGFDDMRKKYVDTVLKLDNSKTILMQIKGSEFKMKNEKDIKVKKGQIIDVDYSEILDISTDVVYTDFPYLNEIPVGSEFGFEGGNGLLRVDTVTETKVICSVVESGILNAGGMIHFLNYQYQAGYLSQRDKQDISWGIQAGVNIIIVPNVQTPESIMEVKEYIKKADVKQLRVFSLIQNELSSEIFRRVVQESDGVIFADEMMRGLANGTHTEYLELCKHLAKPIVVEVNFEHQDTTKKHKNNHMVQYYLDIGVDSLMLSDETAIGDDPIKAINGLYDFVMSKTIIQNAGVNMPNMSEENDSDTQIMDYIIYNAYRITQETAIKAIVCYTSKGITTAKLSSAKIDLPIISFTKSDETYKYVNVFWGVKGYKISSAFNYENLKKIGKEMIRIIFKGNISLDDKILIVLANEDFQHQTDNMINGIEIYKFKDI